MRGMVPGRDHARRSRSPVLREIVLSDQHTLRAFLADAAASVRRVYGGPVSYCALQFERKASRRGGRSAFGWSSSGEWGGVLLADGSWRGEGPGQQVADLVVRGADARVGGLGVPVPVDGQQPGVG